MTTPEKSIEEQAKGIAKRVEGIQGTNVDMLTLAQELGDEIREHEKRFSNT